MNRSRIWPYSALLVLGFGGAASAQNLAPPGDLPRASPSSTVDTRTAWTFADDDILAGPTDVTPPSPMIRIGDRPALRLFFQNLNSRYTGRENFTHLIHWRRAPGFIRNVTTEAALVLRLDVAALMSGNVVQVTSRSGSQNALGDDGSFLRVAWNPNAAYPDDGVALVFFPFDTERFRLGYLYDISWGGGDIFTRARKGPAPGFKLQLSSGIGYYFLGFKTASIEMPVTRVTSTGSTSTGVESYSVEETQYGGMAGAGWDFTPMLRVDLGAGIFQQGLFNETAVYRLPVYTFGGSARVVLHEGIPISSSIDFLLYRNDPASPFVLRVIDDYAPGRLSWSISLEGTGLGQHLQDPNRFGSTVLQPAFAAAAQALVKYGYLRVGATGFYRDLPFILRNVPSFVPFQAIRPGDDVGITPEVFVAASADYYLPRARLLPGIIAGLQFPATFGSRLTVATGSSLLNANRMVVVRRDGDQEILPAGETATPIFIVAASVRWDLSEILYVHLFAQMALDSNETRLQADARGTQRIVFGPPLKLGLGLTVSAHF